jgi:uncharacterized protein
MPMQELVAFIARALVRDPGAVSVSEVQGETERVLELRVSNDDLGRVIGKEGRTAKAIRTVLAVASAKEGCVAKLDIVD